MADRAQAAKQRLLEYRPMQLALPAPGDELVTAAPPPRAKLAQRLQMTQQDSAVHTLPVPLLRKYIAYARAYVHPKLSDEARQVLQAFYLKLRAQAGPMDSAPVTVRAALYALLGCLWLV
jgi:DNA replicative helicase MCM subunit Mcm2 (Cdc46/Mcm family)